MRSVDEDFDITFADIERRAAEEGHSVCDEDGKPFARIPDLIRCAINGSEHKKLCFCQIIDVLEQRFPRWGLETKGRKREKNDGMRDWRSTVRHTLTSRNDFFQVTRPAGYRGRGDWWKIDPHYAEKGLPLRKQSSRRKTKKPSAPKKTKAKSPSLSPSPHPSGQSHPSHSRSQLSPSSPSPHLHRESVESVMDIESPHVPGLADMNAHFAFARPAAEFSTQAYAPKDYAADGSPTPPWAASRPLSDIASGLYVPSASGGIIEQDASRSRSGSTSSSLSAYQSYQGRSFAPIALPTLLDFGDLRQYAPVAAHPVGDDVDAAMRHLSLHGPAASARARSGSTSSRASSSTSRKGGLSIAELVN